MGVSVGITAKIGVPLRLIGLRLISPMGIALVLVGLKSFFTGITPLWVFPVAGYHLVVTQEGWREGTLLASHVLGSVSLLFLLSTVTPAHSIFRAMGAMGVPKGWVEIALLMYRYIFVLLDLTADVTSAQKVRLGYAGLRRGLNSASQVGGTVILRSMDQAVQTNQAMKVRCYRGEIPMSSLPPFRWQDAGLILAVVIPVGVVLVVMEGFWK